MGPRVVRSLLLLLGLGLLSDASVTIYHQQGQSPLAGTGSAAAAAANYTGAAAYNPTVLDPPPVPTNPAINTQITLNLQTNPSGASIQQSGSFLGFSIEMSVVNQVLGKNASFIQVPFLNLMANLQQRVGRINIRVGGNTQETAVLVDSTPDGRILEKDLSGVSNPTQTPPLVFTPELLYMLSNISSLVNVRWYLGIPFNDTSNFRLGIAEAGQEILGDFLIGLQVGNEPDLYQAHGHRPEGYDAQSYFNEFGSLVNAMAGDAHITNQDLLIGPNIANQWTPEQVWNTGFVETYSSNLAFLAVERYPTDNCFAQFGVGTPRTGQDMFPSFLTHASGQGIVAPYLNSTAYAQTMNKQFLMFETNTASCGGFAGLSDSYGAALWGVDYALQMAYSNFSGALFHIGGQSVFYNPFTSPPTNQSTFHQWTIGPIYYSAIVTAEALGASNQSQVLDLTPALGLNAATPAYAIYENGNPVRAVLINFVTDSTGASDVTVALSVSGGTGTPGQVKVKYLSAASVSQKGNITWAGQTFGGNFDSDGRFMGDESIQTVTCAPVTTTDPNGGAPTTSNTCGIKVPAPGLALVFLTDAALQESTDGAGAPETTFSTTARTQLHNTATVDPAVLATSNGHSGMNGVMGSTSKGSVSGGQRVRGAGMGRSVLVVGAAVVVGAGWVMRGLVY